MPKAPKKTPDDMKRSNNPQGVNGAGPKNFPPDDVLSAALHGYAKQDLNLAQRLRELAKGFGVSIGKTKLNELNNKFGVPSSRKRLARETETQAILDIVDKDLHQRVGPHAVQTVLRVQGIAIPRRVVREVMLRYWPEGFIQRFPGAKMIIRTPIVAAGPNQQAAVDGHQKLSTLALRMGPVGIDVYGIKDHWSSYIICLIVVPNCRKAGEIGHAYLDMIEQLGGIPLQITSDHGTEVGWMAGMQAALREQLAPGVDSTQFPPHIFLKSTSNTAIEGLWHWLRNHIGYNIKDMLVKGQTDGIFNPTSAVHCNLFHWIFPPLVQKELDSFREYWNHHKIRKQKNKLMPSSHVPINVYQAPETHGGLDCLVSVPQRMVDELRSSLVEHEGPREQYVSVEFSRLAQAAWERLGSPKFTLQNAWEHFLPIADMISSIS